MFLKRRAALPAWDSRRTLFWGLRWQPKSPERVGAGYNCRHTSKGEPVASLGKQMRARLLRALGRRLTSKAVFSRFRTGHMQQILHARVPILKFICEDTGMAHAADLASLSVSPADKAAQQHFLQEAGKWAGSITGRSAGWRLQRQWLLELCAAVFPFCISEAACMQT